LCESFLILKSNKPDVLLIVDSSSQYPDCWRLFTLSWVLTALHIIRTVVHRALLKEIQVFWYFTPSWLVKFYWCVRAACCSYVKVQVMKPY